MSVSTALTIGALARAAEVGVETIRFYERRGLLAEPPRTAAGYRQYPVNTVDRLRFIRRAQRLGFTLSEISELLELRVDEVAACGTVEVRARDKLADIEGKIEGTPPHGAGAPSAGRRLPCARAHQSLPDSRRAGRAVARPLWAAIPLTPHRCAECRLRADRCGSE